MMPGTFEEDSGDVVFVVDVEVVAGEVVDLEVEDEAILVSVVSVGESAGVG